MITINKDLYRKKLEGCFIGKSVGGTLGGPYEGEEGPLSLTYYDPVPESMLPNDDLDLQVVWLEIIMRTGLPINRHTLSQGWLENIHMFPDEYSVAHRNILRKLYPPMSGAYDNDFTAGMGAAIRSEIWACLAPGCPDLAAKLAIEDACTDHDGDGVDACVFFAVLQSMAFIETDRIKMLQKAFSYLPADSRVKQAMVDSENWWNQSGDWLEVRGKIHDKYAVDNWTDVALNLAYIVLGWLAGGGDFGKSICIANNCGGDTDCTAATLGALLGLMNPDSMDEKWTKPIGRDLVLSPSMVGMHPWATIDQFCDQIQQIVPQVLAYYETGVELSDSSNTAVLYEAKEVAPLAAQYSRRDSLVAVQPLAINLIYPESYAFLPGRISPVDMTVTNPTDSEISGKVYFNVPNLWSVDKADEAFSLKPDESIKIQLNITTPPENSVRTCTNFLDMRFEANGLTWVETAGMAQTIPWQIAKADSSRNTDALSFSPLEINGHTQPLEKGSYCLITEFKVPHHMTACYLAQAKGEVELWLDDKLAIKHDSGFFVPAFHRHEGTGVDFYLDNGWRRACIWVTVEEESPFYFGVGVSNRRTGGYVLDLEWRMPTI